MRLFTGIEIAPDVMANLQGLLERLRPTAEINWSPPQNLHITTKFIGEWPEERLPELKAALDSLSAREPLSIAIEKVGFFPNPHSPRVFWTGVHAGSGLVDLARETDKILAALGVARETRAYSPHLTLARIKTPKQLPALLQAVASLPSLEFGTFTAERFYLYHSRTAPTGSVYTKLSEFSFSK